MPSIYLQPFEYATYGLPATTTAAQVQAASALIDLELKRPDGLVWTPDGTGQPGWMAGKVPTITLTTVAGFLPGLNVTAQVPGNVAQTVAVGDVFIADRSTSGTPTDTSEAVTIQSITPPTPGQFPPVTTLTLSSVVFPHAGPTKLEAGLTCKQHLFMPSGRPVKNLAYTPVIRLISGQGRYGYGRRADASRYMVDEFNLLAAVSHFGGPPVWEFFPMENTNVDPDTGQLWVPAGVMLSYYSEVNIWYAAGFAAAALPDAIKQVCATLVQTVISVPQLGDAQRYQAGDTAVQNRTSSVFSADSKMMLAPYYAKLFV